MLNFDWSNSIAALKMSERSFLVEVHLVWSACPAFQGLELETDQCSPAGYFFSLTLCSSVDRRMFFGDFIVQLVDECECAGMTDATQHLHGFIQCKPRTVVIVLP
mmetsp:Transcript_16046/g.34121  ORF Transcript_16046/g.34121 Transcript_16046/m.34121 type:complete len:105 (-) Transcript_16046:28-342(-)